MHDALEKSGSDLNIFSGPGDARRSYLTPELMAKCVSLFDEAERATANDEAVLLRVQTARMPIMYAQLELGYGNLSERKQVAEKLFDVAARAGLRQFTEWDLGISEYDKVIKDRFQQEESAGVPSDK
jgi:hypothetical protein